MILVAPLSIGCEKVNVVSLIVLDEGRLNLLRFA